MNTTETQKRIKRLYATFTKKEEEIREEIRKCLSAFLMDNDKSRPYECNIALDVKEACGLSSLELPTITSMWQDPSEGYISIYVDGIGECDFDHMSTEELYLLIIEILES